MTLPLEQYRAYGNAATAEQSYSIRIIIREGGMVTYWSFGWDDLQDLGPGNCQRGTFRKWAGCQIPLELMSIERAHALVTAYVEAAQEKLEEEREEMLHLYSTEELEEELAYRRKHGILGTSKPVGPRVRDERVIDLGDEEEE